MIYEFSWVQTQDFFLYFQALCIDIKHLELSNEVFQTSNFQAFKSQQGFLKNVCP